VTINLNEWSINNADGPDEPQQDFGVVARGVDVEIVFKNLRDRLITFIREAPLVVGCVAWLTEPAILEALAHVPHGVSVVVQKEDFLRPDLGSSRSWAASLRRMYDRLPEPPYRHNFDGLAGRLSILGDPSIKPVRCVGNHNADKGTMPRSHHKFIVLARHREVSDTYSERIEVEPYAVWTGSFNFTANAGRSFENAVILRDEAAANAYYHEWTQVLALSEPLDWMTPWAEPEWRIGT
jgi:hypothetical protein